MKKTTTGECEQEVGRVWVSQEKIAELLHSYVRNELYPEKKIHRIEIEWDKHRFSVQIRSYKKILAADEKTGENLFDLTTNDFFTLNFIDRRIYSFLEFIGETFLGPEAEELNQTAILKRTPIKALLDYDVKNKPWGVGAKNIEKLRGTLLNMGYKPGECLFLK